MALDTEDHLALYWTYLLFLCSAGKLWADNCLSYLWVTGESAGLPDSRVCKYLILTFSFVSKIFFENHILVFSGSICHRTPQWPWRLWCLWDAGELTWSVPAPWALGLIAQYMWLPTGTHSVVKERGDVCRSCCFVGWFLLLLASALCNLGNQSWLSTDSALASAVTHSGAACFSSPSGTFSNAALEGLGMSYWLLLARGKPMFPLSQTLKISHGSYPQGIKNCIRCHCDFISALFKEN